MKDFSGKAKTKTNLLVITYWSYKDALVQAYTLPYVNIIHDLLPAGSIIYFVTLEQKHQELSPEDRRKAIEQLKQKGIIWKPYKYHGFSMAAFFGMMYMVLALVRLILFQKIKFIHAWCMPGGAIGYALSVLTGKPMVVDSYEPHAESMVENGTWKKNGWPFRILFFLENKLTHHAHVIISTTEGMRFYSKQKYNADIKSFYVKPACVDPSFFLSKHKKNKELLRQFNLEDKIVCVYTGKFGGIYLEKEVFQFFKVAENYWGNKFHALLLTNHPETELRKWAAETEFDWKNVLIKFVPHEEVPDYMGLGDFAITPVKPVPTKQYCTPIKDGEYWALGLPVVITRNISDDSEIIKKYEIGAVIDELNEAAYLDAVKKIDHLLFQVDKAATAKRIQDVAHQFRDFNIARKIYAEVYGEV